MVVRILNPLYDGANTRDLDWDLVWNFQVPSWEKVHLRRDIIVIQCWWCDVVLDLYARSLQLRYRTMRSFYPNNDWWRKVNLPFFVPGAVVRRWAIDTTSAVSSEGQALEKWLRRQSRRRYPSPVPLSKHVR
jgi:hypothetical protein